jgi:hypothetical protein
MDVFGFVPKGASGGRTVALRVLAVHFSKLSKNEKIR